MSFIQCKNLYNLYHTLHRLVLQCVTVRYSALQFITVRYSALQFITFL